MSAGGAAVALWLSWVGMRDPPAGFSLELAFKINFFFFFPLLDLFLAFIAEYKRVGRQMGQTECWGRCSKTKARGQGLSNLTLQLYNTEQIVCNFLLASLQGLE